MSDQAELLRKRREARQKKILASGESRLSKITGSTANTSQIAPSPSVLLAREQLLKKEEQEKEEKINRIREGSTSPQAASFSASSSTAGDAAEVADAEEQTPVRTERMNESHLRDLIGEPKVQSPSLPRTPLYLDDEDELSFPVSPSQRAAANRIARQQASTPSTTGATAAAKAATVEDQNDADPDDSLGAPPAPAPSSFPFGSAQNNPFMSMGGAGATGAGNPFLSTPQQQQALTRMMQEEQQGSTSMNKHGSQAGSSTGFPPGFTVITPQEDLTARWWKLLHLVMSVLFGFGIVYQEYRRQGDLGRFDSLATDKPLPYGVYQVAAVPVFWYFVTMELILQSSRMVLHGVTASPSSTLGTLAGFLPSPFSDMIRIFMRYRLIWSSLVNDMSVVVFIVGITIALTHMFS